MNSDFKDLLQLLKKEEVEYLIIGGYAVIYHAQPRSTKDLNVWLNPSTENARRVGRVFQEFGIPLIGVTLDDFAHKGLQYAVGVAPAMIDFLTSVPGLDFDECWPDRVEVNDNNLQINFLGKADLIKAKQIAGRPQDLADLEELNRA